MSPNIYADPNVDLGDSTVFLMKKNSSGVLSEMVGSVRVSLRLPDLEPNRYWSLDGGAFASSVGPNKFMQPALCRTS